METKNKRLIMFFILGILLKFILDFISLHFFDMNFSDFIKEIFIS